MLYAIADTHLSFSVEKPMDVFGARWTNHAERLRENWLKKVRPEDTVVIPGDVSWGISLDEAEADLRFLDDLPGKKLLGKGNHDYWWTTANKMTAFFTEKGFSTLSILYNNAYYADGFIVCGTRGWMSEFGVKAEDERIIAREAQRLELSLQAGKKLQEEHPDSPLTVFTHYPVTFGDFINDAALDVLYRYGVEDVYYGHLHNVKASQLDGEYLGVRFHMIAGDYLAFDPLAVTAGN